MKTSHCKWFCCAAIVIMCLNPPVGAGELVDRDFDAANYPYSDHRDFYVYIPNTYNGHTPMPMVMVLHGCHQTRDTVLNEFGWDAMADQYGFILVAPDISTDDLLRSTHCWGYWESKEIHQGQGEVEDLHRIGLQVEREWHININRRHIVGLSSGGFMANAAAVAHNEYWASAGIHSGGGYNESAGTYAINCDTPRESSGRFKSPATLTADMRSEFDNGYTIPAMLFHSQNDCTVGYGVEGDPSEWGGLTSNRNAWLAINGGALFDTADCSLDGIRCQHQKFGTTRRSTLEVVTLVGLIQGTDANKGHYWSGGKTEGEWTKPQGPKAAALFWDFFQRHPRKACDTCPAPPKGLMVSSADEDAISFSWDASAERNTIGYYLYRDGLRVSSDPMADPHFTDTPLREGVEYTYVVSAVNTANEESFPSSQLRINIKGNAICQSYSSSVIEHAQQGRAYADKQCVGWWCWFWPWPKTTHYFTTGSNMRIHTGKDSHVTLYTLDGTDFKTNACSE